MTLHVLCPFVCSFMFAVQFRYIFCTKMVPQVPHEGFTVLLTAVSSNSLYFSDVF
jgi:hypothetical protein